GGIHDFMGEIETFDGPKEGYEPPTLHEHPNGLGWIRIKNPCLVKTVEQKNAVGELISKLGGPQCVYKNYVDIYIPRGESMIEIRELDEEGGLYEAYNKQLNQPKIKNIVVPGMKGYFNPPPPKQ
ncbi:hypothetical protein LDC_2233, partial [sediment metagenome]